MHLSTDMAALTVTVSHRLTSTNCVISREGVMVRCLDSAGKAKTFCLVSAEGEAERVGLLTSATHPLNLSRGSLTLCLTEGYLAQHSLPGPRHTCDSLTPLQTPQL